MQLLLGWTQACAFIFICYMGGTDKDSTACLGLSEFIVKRGVALVSASRASSRVLSAAW